MALLHSPRRVPPGDGRRYDHAVPPDPESPPPPLNHEPIAPRAGVDGRLVVFVMLAIMGLLLLIILV
jgi:hypothetical protein